MQQLKKLWPCRKPKIELIALVLALCFTPRVQADIYNHKVVLVGDKGAAYGGAFAGMADDATATWYNPAGLTQLKQLKLNVSAQIVQYQKQQIEIADNVILPYNSFNFSPSISSLSQRLGKWALGFSIVTPQNDLFRGDQSIQADYRSSEPSERMCDAAEGETPCTSRLNLNYYELSKTILLGPSVAYVYSDNLSVGFTLYGIYSTQIEKTSYGSTKSVFVDGDSTDPAKFYDNVIKRDVNQTGLGMSGVLGVLFKPSPNLSFGVTATPGSYVFIDRDEEQRVEEYLNDTSQVITKNTSRLNGTNIKTFATLYSLQEKVTHTEVTAPSLSLGAAWYPVPKLALTAQVDYRLGSEYSYTGFAPVKNDSAKSGFDGSVPQRNHYVIEKVGVVDFSGGIDLQLPAGYSVALGGFTDRSQGPYDSRPSSWDRRIDWYGVTASLGSVKQYTESRFGISAAWGEAGITHFRWGYKEGGEPYVLLDPSGTSVLRNRQSFSAFSFGIFLSSTLKV